MGLSFDPSVDITGVTNGLRCSKAELLRLGELLVICPCACVCCCVCVCVCCCENSAFFFAITAAASGNIALMVDESRPELRCLLLVVLLAVAVVVVDVFVVVVVVAAPGDKGGRLTRELRALLLLLLSMLSMWRLLIASFRRFDIGSVGKKKGFTH